MRLCFDARSPNPAPASAIAGEDEMDASRKEDEERALALAALALVKATIDALEKKRILEADEVQGIFDGALTSLEFRVQDPAVGLARRIVEGSAVSRAARRPDDESPSQDPS
jgi:hypothetical protein